MVFLAHQVSTLKEVVKVLEGNIDLIHDAELGFSASSSLTLAGEYQRQWKCSEA